MALKVKSPNAKASLLKLGVPEDLVTWLYSGPLHIVLKSTGFVFCLHLSDLTDGKASDMTYSVKMTLDELQKLSAGTLPEARKAIIVGKVVSAAAEIQDCLKDYGVDASVNLVKPDQAKALKDANMHDMTSVHIDPGTTSIGVYALGPAGPITGVPIEKPKGFLHKLPPLKKPEDKPSLSLDIPDLPKIAEVSPQEMVTLDKVDLDAATKMYQPVHGTSGCSRYYVLALGDGIALAGRYKGHKLSLRAAGHKYQTYIKALTAAGLDHKGTYASQHFNTEGPELMRRTLGAVLIACGLSWNSPIPDPNRLIGV